MDKGTQVNQYGGITADSKLVKLPSYLSSFELSVTGAKMKQDMTLCMVNLIFTDKMITDFADDYEKRPRLSLNSYLTEWFLKRFGLYSVAETIIKDFIVSLKYEAEKSDRIKVFNSLAGITFNMDSEMSKATYEDSAFMDRVKV